MQPIPLKFRRLTPTAALPVRATEGAACLDLFVDSGLWGPDSRAYGMHVAPSRPVVFGTGLAVEVPPGHALMIYSRSGHGFNAGVRLANCVGCVDSDFRGEVMVKLTCDEFGGHYVKPGDRIAQAMLIPVPALQVLEAEALSNTQRGSAGLGSTGG